MPVVKGRGSSVQAWKQLHKDFENRGDMLLAKSGTNRSLQRVLDASFDALGAKKQDMLLRMAVLPKGSVAPEDMLQNLWEVEVSFGFFAGVQNVLRCSKAGQDVMCLQHDTGGVT